uniref:Ig-like domain-containing protein n=1 Tax=Mastacembelus armatus TaxID=205130 RepID=A0A7N8YN86_9TELE
RIFLLPLTFDLMGTFVVNVTQSSYQAEENHDITLDWTFTTTAHMSLSALYIVFLFHLHEDVLREGRVRLHVSRLRTEDSGLYLCDVKTNDGADYDSCLLKVTGKLDCSGATCWWILGTAPQGTAHTGLFQSLMRNDPVNYTVQHQDKEGDKCSLDDQRIQEIKG